MDSSQLLGPFVLFLLMVIVGLQLTLPDFRRVLASPRVVLVGTLGQLVLLPLMTWVVISALGLSPVFGAGAVILAASPGAGMSNVMAAVAGAHVALSVTLTAVSSVLAVVTLPFLTALGMRLFIGDAADVEVPVGYLVSQMALFLLLPISLGMAARARFGDATLRYVSWINRIAVVAIIALFERLVPAHSAWNQAQQDVGTDLMHAGVSNLMLPELLKAGFLALLVSAGATETGGFGLWPSSWPLGAELVLALLISQFGEYWAHRAMHQVPLLWPPWRSAVTTLVCPRPLHRFWR